MLPHLIQYELENVTSEKFIDSSYRNVQKQIIYFLAQLSLRFMLQCRQEVIAVQDILYMILQHTMMHLNSPRNLA